MLKEHNYKIDAIDIVDRGYPNTKIIDFLIREKAIETDVITNPPFKEAEYFILHLLKKLEKDKYCILLLRTLCLEGKKRKEIFKVYPPKYILVFSFRVTCAKNGDFDKYSSMVTSYSWFVWQKGYKGETILKWI